VRDGSSQWQIQCDHPDITAIKIWTAESEIRLFSIYIPSIPLYTPNGGISAHNDPKKKLAFGVRWLVPGNP
jgi:hypothetical protein